MSKLAKAADAARTDNLSFEEAMKRLETIVDAMEAEDLPLESLLTRYEEGMKLAKVCQSKIGEAELKIQQLEKNAQGALTLKPVAFEEPEN
ncbi:MAG: Exodeoxyribonuclease 7 small subunit [Verrucomicrobiota bacterium]|jgi:exodeoxyribonuclease VII small subunit